MDLIITAQQLESDLQNNIPLLILDTRERNAFMNGHIEGSASANCSSMQQKQVIISKIPRNYKIILVDDGTDSEQNAAMMTKFGLDAHFLQGGINSWEGKLVKSNQDITISNENLWNLIKNKKDVLLLDVRESSEFTDFKIPGAINIPLSELFTSHIQSIPKNKKIITICSHGNRSMVATFALAQKGFESTSLKGGMAGWNQVLNAIIITQTDDLKIIQIEKIGKGCLSYMIQSNKDAIVIDPVQPALKYQEFAKKDNCSISKVIDTHQHADHVSGAKDLANACGAELYFSSIEEYTTNSHRVNDGDTITVGSKKIQVMHTPGHTRGSMTYLLDEYAFSGDVLFINGVGRPDLREKTVEFAADLYHTLHDKILQLSDNIKIFPAHHSETMPTKDGIFYTTVNQAKKLPLLNLPKDEFVDKIKNITIPQPMNYSMIIKINKGTIPITYEQIPDIEMGPNRCSIKVA